MNRFGLYSSRVVHAGHTAARLVVVEAGKVAAIESVDVPSAATVAPLQRTFGLDSVIDCGADVIMSGLVDSHVHLNEPGRVDWEGFETATRAAAAGGVTTLVDMPLNCIPVTTTAAAFDEKLAAVDSKLSVDIGFWGGVVPGNARELEAMANRGVLGFKAFLIDSGIEEFPRVDESDLRTAMAILSRLGLPLLAHAELDCAASVDVAGGPTDYNAYLRSRPAAWEDDAIALLIRLSRETGCHVHIVHLSSATGAQLIGDAKASGVAITAETCPHYLCFDAESIPNGATQYKCAPPVRERANRDALWAALKSGVIDFVVTDHSPCTAGLKCLEKGDFFDAWGGISSLQLGLSAVWTEARQRGVSLSDIARWMSTGPANLAGLSDRGELRVGARADIVVWAPDETFVVEPERLFMRNKVTPYAGRELYGAVRETFLAGESIYSDAANGDSLKRARDAHRARHFGQVVLGRLSTYV